MKLCSNYDHMSQWVSEAPASISCSASRSDSILSRFLREAELASASLTRAASHSRPGVHRHDRTHPRHRHRQTEVQRLPHSTQAANSGTNSSPTLRPASRNSPSGSPSKASRVSTPAWKRPALTAKRSRSSCTRRGTPSASLTRRPSKPLPGAAFRAPKQTSVDAELIARFCLAQAPPVWTPLPQEVRELQALVRRLESLIEMRVAEENRLSSGITVDVGAREC